MEVQGRVFCTAREQTMRVGECGTCPHFVKVTAGSVAGGEEVHCAARSAPPPVAPEPRTSLVLPVLAVSALMTRAFVCVRPEVSLDEVTRLFVESGLEALPVVESDGCLLGFISQTEVMMAIHVGGSSAPPRAPSTVADITLPLVLSLPESASVAEAAAVMAFEGQHRLAVVSPSGVLVGVLSALEVMQWLARADGYLLPRVRSC
jgi:CBS domain-containing protein